MELLYQHRADQPIFPNESAGQFIAVEVGDGQPSFKNIIATGLRSTRTGCSAVGSLPGLPAIRPQSEGKSDIGQLPLRQVLTPVIDHVGARPIESVRMRTLHGYALHRNAITVGAHAPVRTFTG